MIDLQSEALVAVSEIPDLLPRRRGRKIHVSTIYRWAQQGIGGVRLETTRLGGLLYTSREALQKFMEQLNLTEGRP